MNDVAGVIEDVEEMAIMVPHILTQMVERAVDVPQISTDQQTVPMPQVTTQVVDRPYPVSQFRQWKFQFRDAQTQIVENAQFPCIWRWRRESVREAD